jgi:hypothetical protein
MFDLTSEGGHSMERHSSRLSDVSFTMDRTSFADPDRLTVLMTEPQDLKHELSLHIIESIPFDTETLPPEVYVLNASPKLDILCINARRAKVLHLYYLSGKFSTVPVLKEKVRVPALGFAPVTLHRSQRLLVLSPDLIIRIHAPWLTRLNIVIPMTQRWRSISKVQGNYFKLTDSSDNSEQYHLELAPEHDLIERCMDVLECLLDANLYALFLSVYATAKIKSTANDVGAFTISLFACFLAFNTRSPSPSPGVISEQNFTADPWTLVVSSSDSAEHDPQRYIAPAGEFVYHFEGTQRSKHLFVMFLALHALSEELRMHLALARHNRILVPLLIQLAYWIGKPAFVDYYLTSDITFTSMEFDKRSLAGVRDAAFASVEPWSIYNWLICCVKAGVPRVSDIDILSLDDLLVKLEKPSPQALVQARSLLPSIHKLRQIYPVLNHPDFRAPLLTLTSTLSVTKSWIHSLPLGVSYPLTVALSICRKSPLPSWSSPACELIGRKDLVEFQVLREGKPHFSTTSTKIVEEPTSVAAICAGTLRQEGPWTTGPKFVEDHELITKLIFRRDRRMGEVTKLVEFSQPGLTFWYRPQAMLGYFFYGRRLMQRI